MIHLIDNAEKNSVAPVKKNLPETVEALPLVEVRRGSTVESVHYGHFAVVSPSGELLDGAGNPDLVTFPRSSLKLIQAIQLVESGAADHFKLGAEHISLSCASHKGESFHINTVSEWLGRIQCTSADLKCGPDLPRNTDAMESVLSSGGKRETIYHNCSGKHTGFLSVCKHCGHDPNGYHNMDHPVQQRFIDDLSLLTAEDARGYSWGIDGCTLAAPAMPIVAMAGAMARMASTESLAQSKRDAIDRVLNAVADAPAYISGTNQLATDLCVATKGRIILKPGADGYYVAIVRDQGIGVALKIADGASRASSVAITAVLRRIGALDAREEQEVAALAYPDVTNSRAQVVGSIRPLI